jgi:hypothetical protein
MQTATTQTAVVDVTTTQTQTDPTAARTEALAGTSLEQLLSGTRSLVNELVPQEAQAASTSYELADLESQPTPPTLPWRSSPRMFGAKTQVVPKTAPPTETSAARVSALVALASVYSDDKLDATVPEEEEEGSEQSHVSVEVVAEDHVAPGSHDESQEETEAVSSPPPDGLVLEATSATEALPTDLDTSGADGWVVDMPTEEVEGQPSEPGVKENDQDDLCKSQASASLDRLDTWELLQQQLFNLGFTDESRNLSLLIQHEGDINGVVLNLIGEAP